MTTFSPRHPEGALAALPLLLRDHPELRADAAPRCFAKGEYVMLEGTRDRRVHCLEKGLVKLCLADRGGGERIKSFVEAPGLFASLETLTGGGDSPFTAVCLEACVIRSVPYEALERARLSDPTLAGAVQEFLQALAVKKERRERSLLTLKTGEAYREFREHHAALAPRLTQADIARYLGVTPVALSRALRRGRDGS